MGPSEWALTRDDFDGLEEYADLSSVKEIAAEPSGRRFHRMGASWRNSNRSFVTSHVTMR